MKTLRLDRWLPSLLHRLAGAVCRQPRWFLLAHLVLAAAGVLYTVQHLQFDTSRGNLVGKQLRYHQNFLRFREEFPKPDDLVVVVESDDAEANRQFVERLAARLEREPELFPRVFYKGDLKLLGNKALHLLSESQLQSLRDQLQAYQPFLRSLAGATNLVSLFDQVNTWFRTSRNAAPEQQQALLEALPALERILSQAAASLHRPGLPPSPGVSALFNAGEEAVHAEYLAYNGGRLFLVTTHPPSVQKEVEAIDRLRQLVEETRREVPGVNVGVTGETVLEHDEMRQARRDTTQASVWALVLCAALFIAGYRETGRPLKAMATLLIGVAHTLAFATATVGHLNILTITFVPILVGLAIDFGIHLVTRYEEELRMGHGRVQALERAMVNTGQGICTGALTTAGGFLAMSLTQFKGIQEMGWICGGGMLICLVTTLTFLPALLLAGRQNLWDETSVRPPVRARIEQLWLRRPRTVLGISGLLTVAAAGQALRVPFDYNLLNLQSQSLPAVVFEKKLIESAGRSLLYGVVIADSLPEAQRLQAQLEQLPAVASVESLAPLLAAEPGPKSNLICQIRELAATVRLNPPDATPVALGELSRTLWGLSGYLGLALENVGTNDPALASQLERLRHTVIDTRRAMLDESLGPESDRARKLGLYQRAFFTDLQQTFRALQEQDPSGPMQLDDLPPALRERFVGKSGKLLLQVFPKDDVWQRQPQEQFVRQLRTVDPDATGTPVQLYEYTTLLKQSYETAAWYALAAITVLVAWHFRSPLAVVLALLPVGLGMLWMTGWMGWREVPFNPANIMTLPLVVGIGVTNGIHILNRFAEEQEPGLLAKSTGKAVLVSGLTTVAGFGSLMLADHQGIASLGFVMSTGVTACMVAGLAVLPALLVLLAGPGSSRGR
ncbi:MMPL family transporter [Limisphaera sp. VF-2]|jgi:hopanoid biosynthesis associated RND transporter like protein HpnN|uniref:MMPL family transporter n=1 Tax=Limisphaera sp. VF-2 TaxID=3400418 RepID=UPI00176CACED|nr:MMPL family transporter [Limisphaera sp.]